MITEGVQQVLTVLYPLYKDEVYKRREQMMRLTAFGAFGLILIAAANSFSISCCLSGKGQVARW